MADERDKETLVAEFVSVTGVEPERADFYLSLAGWDISIALSSFYDEDQGDNLMASEHADDKDYVPPEEVPLEQPKKKTTRAVRGNITTFGSLADDNEEDSDEEEGQAFYAGGSEHSGQQIVGPPRKKKDGSDQDVTQGIFDAAKRHGAEVVDPGQEQSRKNKGSAFGGSGHRLGETPGESSDIGLTSAHNVDSSEPVEVTLTFWSNGFSIDNGPLRDVNAPENQEFLESVKQGEIPRELLRLNRGGEVHVNMVDKRHEEFVKPKQTIKAFSGEGHKLGSPTPKIVGQPRTEPQPNSAPPTQVDSSAPVTNIQIRLADGTRLVSKFNHTHKISDVRNFVAASRPQAAGRHFVLMTTFPNKELTNESQTLEEAKLLNAVIVQRLK